MGQCEVRSQTDQEEGGKQTADDISYIVKVFLETDCSSIMKYVVSDLPMIPPINIDNIDALGLTASKCFLNHRAT